ncbi:MAG TPA: UvrD-helicase domain-containing protein [Candidatus Paceibacterota bacterium]|nr:UvrD-helicase domain-containing protein [Candidatus Paceibacterota bacterium]
MQTFLEGLNNAQQQAVLATEGPLLIVAGAGAGKTKTIAHRICRLVANGVSPRAILAVTFTNKAAREMRERVQGMLAELPEVFREGETPFVSTFHSLGVFLLRKFGAHEGEMKRFVILDEQDALSLIKEALVSLGLEPKQHDPRAIKGTISRSKNDMIAPEELLQDANPRHRLAGRVWQVYDRLKRQQKALDFDDLLLETATLLAKNNEALAWCHATWKYIHVDEYQDTNDVQYDIARALAGTEKNLCVVGDSDQSIYSWRGANIKNILEFEKDFPEATVVVLGENYRSTKNVIAAANEIISKNDFRTKKELFTNNADGEHISLYAAYDEADEANFIVERVIEHMDAKTPAENIAVLFRTNFQSRVLEEAFLDASIPYHVLGVRFFERKEIKDALAYIRAALNPDSLVDIKRSIATPSRGIGKVTLAKLFAGERNDLSGKMKLATDNYFSLLEKIAHIADTRNTSETLRFVIKESGMEAMYKDEGDDERLENLRELVTLGVKYDRFAGRDGIEKLLEEATLMSDQDALDDESKKGVKLMTVHAAKGLEFEVVFVAGLEQGLFPHERDEKLTGPDAEEERRLMYVAITRARKKLYLTYASVRTIYGMRDVRMPSEFLLDIPEELIERESREGEVGFGTTVYL